MTIKKDSLVAWCIWIVAAMFFFLEYVIRVSPTVMAQHLIKDFNITAYSLGVLSAYYYYAYIAMQIPVGILLDRYSVRFLLSSMAFLCAASAILFARTHTLGFAEFSRLLIGVTGAFAFVGALKLASLWFSPNRFGFLAGITQALGMLGASAGIAPLAVTVEHIGWRSTLMILGVLVAILAVVIFVIVRDSSDRKNRIDSDTLITGIAVVLKNPMTWINGLVVGLLYMPTGAFGELWGSLYIQRVYNVTPEVAASLVSCIFIGWAIGGPLFGRVSDSIGRRKPIILGSAILSLIFILILLYMPFLPMAFLFVIAFLYGVSNIGVATCYASACEINPRKFAGSSLGFTNMASIILGAIFQPIIGKLLDLNWDGHYLAGSRYYSAHDFQISMAVLPLGLIVCIVVCFFLKESFGMSGQERQVQPSEKPATYNV